MFCVGIVRVLFLVCLIFRTVFPLEVKLLYITGQSIPNFRFERNQAAPALAIDKAKIDGVLGDNDITILYRDDQFNNAKSMGYAIELYQKEKINGFIGLGSSNVLKNTGLLMAHWNLPAFTQAGTDPVLQDKTRYKTLMRLVPPSNKVGNVVRELVLYFGWNRVLLIGRYTGLCEYSARAIFSELTHLGVMIPSWVKYDPGLDEEDLDSIVNIIRSTARVVFFCGNQNEKTKFLIRVQRENLTTPEYVYIMPPYRPLDQVFEPWADNSNPDQDDLLKASRAVIQISLFDFDEEAVEKFLQDHVDKMVEIWNYNLTAEKTTTSIYALFLHDATYLYALALNKTLEAGEDPQNGTKLVEIARGLTFTGASGHVAFDDNGDREPTCTLFFVRPGENKSRILARAILSNPEGQRVKIAEEDIWRTPDGSIPLDEPICGFLGDKCNPPQDQTLPIVIGSIASVVVLAFGVIVILFIIRQRSIKQKLNELRWKIDYNHITFIDRRKVHHSLTSLGIAVEEGCSGLISVGRSSLRDSHSEFSNIESIDGGQLFTKVANYKGHLVSVKFVHSIKFEQDTVEELCMMLELKHSNLSALIGVCVHPDKMCILTEYCRKGSLQDVLENDNIQLDNIFKESLIFDIVNGMAYLHTSPLMSHGNLKSSNCVIDSRWVLKITDFHPKCVIKKSNSNRGEYEKYWDKLWTAPELLRTSVRTCRGTRPGDVFSFAIILQEILYRALPYFGDISPQDIIDKVMCEEGTPFRPKCPSSSSVKECFVTLMTDCWAETPIQRPSFVNIRKTLGKISERGEGNIMDRIIQKLESYSSNLEDIVRERTVALSEEKMKTDSLLYQMLPTVIADKLKQGQYVSPQLFGEATVYFSDILGFVEMAAESSPLEVVTLLNDLYEMLDSLIRGYDVYKKFGTSSSPMPYDHRAGALGFGLAMLADPARRIYAKYISLLDCLNLDVETIGDSYMVVSGIPVANEHRHVVEIAEMSLHVLQSAQTFHIRHRPGEKIQLRVGFHTGPCCAGVVGLAMPRYCLFGDTVNTASRMESNGKALKIHISRESKEALSEFGDHDIVERGEVFVKGKGMLTTYWLEGRDRRR